MREIKIGKGIKPKTRADVYLRSVFPALSLNALYKAFRKKDVKVGGKWVTSDMILKPQDTIEIYLPDDILFGNQLLAPRPSAADGFSVAYEDNRLLIVNKPQGLPVHPDRYGSGVTLIELVHEYLGLKTAENQQYDIADVKHFGRREIEYVDANMYDSDSFAPALCHRLDRNTGGLVVIAKDKNTLNMILAYFASGDIKKEYRCIVHGKLEAHSATLRAYMTKDSAQGQVRVYKSREDAPLRALEIVTRYTTISYDPKSDTSKLDVLLLTGRTHQIRAHLASIGHPVIGDGKYCPNAINKLYQAPYQMLIAFRLTFPAMEGMDVSNKKVEIPDGLSHPTIK